MSESSDDEEGRFNKFKTTRSPDKTEREDSMKQHTNHLDNSRNSSVSSGLKKNIASVRLKKLQESLVNDVTTKNKLTNSNKAIVSQGYGNNPNVIEAFTKHQLPLHDNNEINSKLTQKNYVRSSGHPNQGYGNHNTIEPSSKHQHLVNGNIEMNCKSTQMQYVRNSGSGYRIPSLIEPSAIYQHPINGITEITSHSTQHVRTSGHPNQVYHNPPDVIKASTKHKQPTNSNIEINSQSTQMPQVRPSGHTIYPWVQPLKVTSNDLIHLNLPNKSTTTRNHSNKYSANDRITKIRNLQRNGEAQVLSNSMSSRKRSLEGNNSESDNVESSKKSCPMKENPPPQYKTYHLPPFSHNITTSNETATQQDFRAETKVNQSHKQFQQSVSERKDSLHSSTSSKPRSAPVRINYPSMDRQESRLNDESVDEVPKAEIDAKLARTAMWVNHVAKKQQAESASIAKKQQVESSSASVMNKQQVESSTALEMKKQQVESSYSSINVKKYTSSPSEKELKNAGTSISSSPDKMDWEDVHSIAEETIKSDPVIEKKIEIPQTSGKSKDICLVVDTNVFIRSLSKIEDIMNMEVKGDRKPVLLIPWMVITELDFMKDSCFSAIMRANISRSVKLIHKALEENNPRMIGQTVFEMDQQRHIGASQDDKIMSCCLQAAEKYESVILLSNDINLKSKSMINGIEAISSNDILMKLMFKLGLNVKFIKIKQMMGTLWSSIICKCAEKTYGNVWKKMNLLSDPPWSVPDCLKIFKKYWPTVFRERVMKQFIKAVDNLTIFLSDKPCIRDETPEYVNYVKMSLSLSIFLKDIEECRESIQNAITEITKIG